MYFCDINCMNQKGIFTIMCGHIYNYVNTFTLMWTHICVDIFTIMCGHIYSYVSTLCGHNYSYVLLTWANRHK